MTSGPDRRLHPGTQSSRSCLPEIKSADSLSGFWEESQCSQDVVTGRLVTLQCLKPMNTWAAQIGVHGLLGTSHKVGWIDSGTREVGADPRRVRGRNGR